MKAFLKKIIYWFCRFLIAIGGNRLNDLYKRSRQYIYNVWCNLRYKTLDCEYVFPINHITNNNTVKIGEKVKIGKGCIIATHERRNSQLFSPIVDIGDNCVLSDFVNISCINHIKIGSGVGIGRWVTITDNSHGNLSQEEISISHKERPLVSKGEIIIDDNVWIGDKVTVLPGVHLGNGCIVGANSVVTKSFPPHTVIAGNPAKILKFITRI